VSNTASSAAEAMVLHNPINHSEEPHPLKKLAGDGLLHSANHSMDTGLIDVAIKAINEATNANDDDEHDSRTCTTLLNPKLK